jgi:hypothetical protein
MQTYWFLALVSSICLEGLGRRYVPQIPTIAFYFLKDIVLLAGFVFFRPSASVVRIGKYLFRGFGIAWIAAFIWTVCEAANPEQTSIVLAMVGLRAYWLWWLAPFVIAGVLQSQYHRRRATFVLAFMATGIAVLAALQFISPADSAINAYSIVDGETLYASDAAMVYTTGRARVASTFAFPSGFTNFTILVPVILLSLGLETSDRRLRAASLVGTALTAIALPMSGSRSSVVLGLGVLVLTCWSAGLFFTRAGRRILMGGVVGIVVGAVLFPDAIFGVQSRFMDSSSETMGRLTAAAAIIPPVALATFEYPLAGTGTGTMQNAATSFHVSTQWTAEIELHRYLVELGPVGFLFAWATKLGLMVAFLRAYSIFKKAGRRSSAGAALSYAAVTFFGSITFDHIWQSLYFVGAGFILAETKSALDVVRANAQPKVAELGPPPVSLRP